MKIPYILISAFILLFSQNGCGQREPFTRVVSQTWYGDQGEATHISRDGRIIQIDSHNRMVCTYKAVEDLESSQVIVWLDVFNHSDTSVFLDKSKMRLIGVEGSYVTNRVTSYFFKDGYPPAWFPDTAQDASLHIESAASKCFEISFPINKDSPLLVDPLTRIDRGYAIELVFVSAKSDSIHLYRVYLL